MMYQETRSVTPRSTRKTLRCVAAVLFSLALSFGLISHAAAGSTAVGSTVAGSTADSRRFTVAGSTPPLANFTTAIFAYSTMGDFITMASAAGLSWFPLSAAGGGVADGVGPITIHTEAITGTDLTPGTGALIRRAIIPM
jgi:hypothetical protein